MNSKKIKAIIIALCAVALVSVAVVGTIAYLTDTTETVTNTFVVGQLFDPPESATPSGTPDKTKLDFVILEHKAYDGDGTVDTKQDGAYTLGTEEVLDNEYKVIPGVDIPKDPFVKTNKAVKIDAYCFVEVVDKTSDALHFTINSDNWTLLEGYKGTHEGKVYVLKANDGVVSGGSSLAATPILKDNKITVDNVEITDPGKVLFYAYLIQSAGFDDAEAAALGLGFTKTV